MNDQDIRSEIAYLDDFENSAAEQCTEAAQLPRDMALLFQLFQMELAKQAHLQNPEELVERVASIESRLELLRKALVIRRGFPVVQYVHMPPDVLIAKQEERIHAPAIWPAPSVERDEDERTRRLHRYRIATGSASIIWLLASIAALGSRLHPEPFFALFFSTFGLYIVFAMKSREL